MNPLFVLRLAVLASAQVVVLHAADAQTPATKPPPPVTKAAPRLPPNAAESARIPAGVDTGSPATSDTLPLGTPVPPVLGADRTEIRNRSAAARAAARPKLAASGADCARGSAAETSAGMARPSALASGKTAPIGSASAAQTTVLRGKGADC